MDIMNELPPRRFEKIDDLLAFVSIYDDRRRTAAYFQLLEAHEAQIRNAVCVEAGCGFGLLSEKLAQLGAGRVYAVETNPYLAEIARKRLAPYRNCVVVQCDIRRFIPTEPVDVLVHELFGQLLYDEDLYSLEALQFAPRLWLPDGARLQLALLDSSSLLDDVVTAEVLRELRGALVSGLFDAEPPSAAQTVIEWRPGYFPRLTELSLQQESDLLCFFLEILHQGRCLARAGECDNWSPVWTPRAGNAFQLRFTTVRRGTNVFFSWKSERRYKRIESTFDEELEITTKGGSQ